MPNLSIKDVPEAWAEALRQRAARNHRSLQGELMAHRRTGREAGNGIDPLRPWTPPNLARRASSGTTHAAGPSCNGGGKPSNRSLPSSVRADTRQPTARPLGVDIIREDTGFTMSSAPPQLYVAEPPAGYLVLPPLVVDCSVMVAAMFEEPARDQAIALMSGKLLFAPGLLVHEMVNVAAKKLRAGSPTATSGRLWRTSPPKPSSFAPPIRRSNSNSPCATTSAATTPPTCGSPPS